MFPLSTDVLRPEGGSEEFPERELDKTWPFFLLKNGTELSEGFLRDCHPTLTYVLSSYPNLCELQVSHHDISPP